MRYERSRRIDPTNRDHQDEKRWHDARQIASKHGFRVLLFVGNRSTNVRNMMFIEWDC
jgi:hypothetical protein